MCSYKYRCQALTKVGRRCKLSWSHSFGLCHIHATKQIEVSKFGFAQEADEFLEHMVQTWINRLEWSEAEDKLKQWKSFELII